MEDVRVRAAAQQPSAELVTVCAHAWQRVPQSNFNMSRPRCKGTVPHVNPRFVPLTKNPQLQLQTFDTLGSREVRSWCCVSLIDPFSLRAADAKLTQSCKI